MVTKKISFQKKVIASIGYGLSGLILMFMNKIVLTNYMFPYYTIMALMQATSICLTLFILKLFKIVSFPSFSFKLIRQLFPIPVFYLINLLTGLGATKYISVPMFVALRRFTIPLTIVLQYYILNTKISSKAIFAIFLLITGSLIACLQDFQFNLFGYFLCLLNDVGDSCEAILTKKQLNLKNHNDELNKNYRRSSRIRLSESNNSDNEIEELNDLSTNSSKNSTSDLLIVKKYDKNQNLEEYYGMEVNKKQEINSDYQEINIGKVAIIYYCALLSIGPLIAVCYYNDDFEGAYGFDYWSDTLFTLMFISCSFFSLVFLLSWITCTDFNSPLLSQIVSVMRSILSTYIGMYVGGDYIFNITNFFGLNLSMFGAFLYTYFNFSEEHEKEGKLANKKEDGSTKEKESFIV